VAAPLRPPCAPGVRFLKRDHCLVTTSLHLPPLLATVVFMVGIAGLFWLDRDPEARVSRGLWIPTIWLMLTGSRPVSEWLGMSPRGTAASIYAEGSPIDRTVIMVLVAAAFAVVVSRWGQAGPILRKSWPIVLFFSYAACSVLWSDDPFVTFKHWIKGIGDVAIVLIVLTEPDVTDAIKRLVTRLGFTLLPLSVLLGKYYPGLGRFVNRSWVMEWTGVAAQKNSLGLICLVLGLGLLWRFRSTYNDREDPHRGRRLVAFGTVLGMAVWLLWMCDSMTSISALAMTGAVMLFSARPGSGRRPALIHIMVAGVLGITLYALFFQSSGAFIKDLGRNPTLTGRTEIWSEVLSIPDNRVVGAGYESFWLGDRLVEIQNSFHQPLNEAHDGYLEMLLNLGWIGVALLGLLIAVGYRNVIRAYRHEPDTGSLRVAYFAAVLVCNLTTAQFRMMTPPWIFFLLVVMAVPDAASPEGPHGVAIDYAGNLSESQGDHALSAGYQHVNSFVAE
jgi:exopolysaccharide production protein ExoQ